MPAVRVSPPPALVTAEQVKLALRLDQDMDDDRLTNMLIPAAIGSVEGFTSRALGPQRWRLTLDRWTPVIRFPWPRLRSVVSVSYRAPNGVTTTLDPSLCIVDPDSPIGRMAPASRTAWPTVDCGLAPIAILYEAGWPSVAEVPVEYITAVIATVRYLYDTDGTSGLPEGVRKDLAGKRIRWFGECP